MISYHVAYGLRLSVNVPLPGLPVQSALPQIDVRISLNEKSRFPRTFSVVGESPLYLSPNRDENGQSALRVAASVDGQYFGFFYQDGATFAVERTGDEVFGDWPENYTVEDACTYLMGPVLAFVLRLRGLVCL